MKLILFIVLTFFSSSCIDASDEKPKRHRSLPEDTLNQELNIPSRSHSQDRSKSPNEKISSGRENDSDVKVIGYAENPTIRLPMEADPLIKNQELVCKDLGNYYGSHQFEFSTIFSLRDQESYCSFLSILSPCAKRIILPGISFLDNKGKQIVQFILDNKIYHCLIQDKNNKTVLHIAARHHDLKTVKEILSSSEQMFWTITSLGNTIFHALFLNQNTRKKSISELIDYLYKHNQLTNDLMLNHQNNNGNTALHLACEICHFSGIRSLIWKHTKLNIQNLKKKSALDILFRHYFSLEKELYKTPEKQTHKMKALKKKRNHFLKIIQMMLKKDALLTYKSRTEDNSPLHIAIRKEYEQLLKVLVKNKTLLESRNTAGDTPIHYAIKKGMLHYLPFLCTEKNKSLNVCNKEGLTALAILFNTLFKELPKSTEEQKRKIEVHHTLVSYIELLLKNGADPDTYEDEEGNNALHLACQSNNPKLVELLITHGIDMKKQNNKQKTALHLVIRDLYIDPSIFPLFFLRKDTSIFEVKDKNGNNPWTLIQTREDLLLSASNFIEELKKEKEEEKEQENKN